MWALLLLSFVYTGDSLPAHLNKEHLPCRDVPGRPSKLKDEARRLGRDVAVAGPDRLLAGRGRQEATGRRRFTPLPLCRSTACVRGPPETRRGGLAHARRRPPTSISWRRQGSEGRRKMAPCCLPPPPRGGVTPPALAASRQPGAAAVPVPGAVPPPAATVGERAAPEAEPAARPPCARGCGG